MKAQTIFGKVESTTGEKIEHAQIILKDSANALQIKEFAFVKSGVYQFQIKKQYKSVWIEISSLGYKKQGFLIDTLLSQAYQYDFILEPQITELKEIIISDTRKYEQNGDTTSFNVSTYRDGTERRIEDIIKKLPNIEVNENTGAIKYKGKSIKAVNLDGDDLFDENYAVGTRNIDVDMVEQVQAIENYNENPLLHGLDSEEDVALNLVLKKTKTKYSGNVRTNLGLFFPKDISPAADLSGTVLGIATQQKSFVTLSYNNVGANNTPYNYTEYSEEIDATQNPEMYAKKYIPDSFFSTSVGTQRSNFNNTLFGSFNTIFKIKRRLKIKINLFYLNDKIASEQFARNDYNFNNEVFSTTDEISIQKKPLRYVGKLQANYNLSKKSLLEFHGSYDVENINTSTFTLLNNMTDFDNILRTSAYLLKNKIIYTNRISKNTAFQLTGHYVAHQAPQKYLFVPAVYQSDIFDVNTQLSEFKKDYIAINASLLNRRDKQAQTNLLDKDKDKYEIFVGLIAYTSLFDARLLGNNTQGTLNIPNFENAQQYQYRRVYGGWKYNYQKENWKINTSFKASYLGQILSDYSQNKQITNYSLLIEPKLGLNYEITKKSTWAFNASYTPIPFSEGFFVSNPVFLSPRNMNYYEVNLATQQNVFVSSGYIFQNSSRTLKINLTGLYSINKGNYYNRLFIQPNSTASIGFFLPESNTTRGITVMTEKYIHTIESTIRLQTNFNVMNYLNALDEESLRRNKVYTIYNELFFKTAFDIMLNFENVLKHSWSNFRAETKERFTNQSLTNTFKVIIKPNKKSVVFLYYDYFLPSFERGTSSISFLDLEGIYQSKKTNWSISIKNILNVRTFDQISVNDFSTYLYQINLLPRHLLLKYSLSF